MSMIWHFPSTDGGPDEGINDSGVWQFEGNRESSVARECIQNSLDARVDENKPVRVVFSKIAVDNYQIPFIDGLNSIIKKARDYASGQEKAMKFYEDAITCLGQSKVDVLRISDYNTTGLDEDRWYHLVCSTGSSPSRSGSGGSFGIGKSAPFAASAIRTVFYSTMLADGSVAFQGNTRISSFKDDDNDIHRGVGSYGVKNEERPGVIAIRNRFDIPDVFERNERGTDVIVMGYRHSDDWEKRIIGAVAESFYVAIIENQLEVIIEDEDKQPIIINRDTLAEIIDRYVDDEDTILYYKTAINPSRVFHDDIPGIGAVDMYVLIGEGKKHVQGMRKTLMKIHDFSRLRTLDGEYAGVVIVRGDDGNRELRSLEPPAHDEWKLDLGEDNAKEMLKRLRWWVVENLRSIANEREATVEEIPELSKYLPQDTANDDRDPIFSNNGEQTDGDNETETANERGVTDNQNGKINISVKDRVANITKPGTTGGKSKRVTVHPGTGGGGNGGEGAGEPEGNTTYADVSDMLARTKELLVNGKKLYQITITPTKDDTGDIRIVGIGDGANFPLDLLSAYDESGNQLEIKGETIKNLSFVANQTKILTVELMSSRRYVVGVA